MTDGRGNIDSSYQSVCWDILISYCLDETVTTSPPLLYTHNVIGNHGRYSKVYRGHTGSMWMYCVKESRGQHEVKMSLVEGEGGQTR